MDRQSLPVDVSDFSTIDKIYYDQVAQKWVYEDETEELLFDLQAKRWVKKLENLQDAGVERTTNETVVDEEKNTMRELRMKKKQKLKEIKEQEKEARQSSKRNTSVYISNLPLDVTKEELETTFSKFGVLAEDAILGSKRIKVYEDDNGNPKGDALVQYYRSESVELAIDMLDDTEFRIGNGHKLKVQRADFAKYGNNGDAKRPRQIDEEALKKRKKVAKKLDDKIFDWEESEELREEKRQRYLKRYEKTVVLYPCFSIKEIEEDPEVVYDIEDDILEECSKFGEVLKVIVCDLEPTGVVLVKYETKEAALSCVDKLNGRYFGGEKIEAAIYDGKPYKKSKKGGGDEERLKEYEEFLQS